MAKERWISIDSPTQWRAALRGLPHAFGHTWEHCRAAHAHSGSPVFLYEVETDAGRFVCPIEERTFDETRDLVTPPGFSGFIGAGDSRGAAAHWSRSAGSRGYVCGYLVSNPALGESAVLPRAETYHAKSLYVLDLTGSLTDLLQNMPPKRRHQLEQLPARAESIVVDKARLTRFILDTYESFFAERDATSTHGLSAASVVSLAAADNVIMVGIQERGDLIAASMFGYTSSGADYLFNVAEAPGRRHSAALIWWAIEQLQEREIPHLNLGGGLVEGDGISRFKGRFGAARIALPVVKQIYDRSTYAELCRRAGADPADLSGYFPAYRRAERRNGPQAPPAAGSP